MKLRLSGRADLIRTLAHEDPALTTSMSALLGYSEAREARQASVPLASESQRFVDASPGERARTPYEPADVPFWRLESYEAAEHQDYPLAPPPPNPHWRQRPTVMPGFSPLASKQVILTRLRRSPAMRRATNEIDVEAVVDRLSRIGLLDGIPRRQRRVWGSNIHIVEDRSRRLAPYWLDQEYVMHIVRQMYPPGGVTVARMEDGEREPVIRWPKAWRGRYLRPSPGTMVVVLGDLGCLANEPIWLQRFWLHLGQRLRELQIPAVALAPMAAREVPHALARVWTVVRWDAVGPEFADRPPELASAAVAKLLTLLSPALRLEPGLLRAVRSRLPEGRRDAGLEARVWQSGAIASRHSAAATFEPGQRQTYLSRFADEPEDVRRFVIGQIRAWRAHVHESVWFEEVIGLDPQSQHELVEAEDVEDARGFLTAFDHALESQRPSPDTEAWVLRLAERLPPEAWRRNPSIQRLYELVKPRDVDAPVPVGYDPARSSPTDQSPRFVMLWQLADRLRLQPADAPTATRASPLGALHTANGEVTLATGVDDFWQTGQPPAWAQDWGRDAFGPWVTFRMGEAEQRLRWMPLGRFTMGSPEDEEGRWDDEGPQHEVLLSRGFWLFDTPCTQTLWQAVMGENPSEFKGENRPVEQVSWEDCQRFIEVLNAKLPGLELQLPTEAQWEYACRAGTTEARYHEDLDTIAWYDNNSGDETHDVAQKLPNAWGLYDMLGNVYEWCHDGWRRVYTDAAVVDPVGSAEEGADRVIRGGGWIDSALGARAACRSADVPGGRDDGLGFRCSSSSLSEPRRARVTWREPEQKAEPAEAAPRRPAARLLHVQGDADLATALPDDDGFRLHTDRDRLTFRRITRPPWAAEMGRDAYGLWAMLEVDGVQQRLRWIPPGRFWVGSPDTDHDAFDFEKPQHEVLLSRGFWLFDTPCTQALWQVVMRSNPSRFKGKNLPVERVRWGDCQTFIQRLNERFDELDLGLPTEAEWEYACRAGTQTPRYAEDLDRIAWYRENSDHKTHDVGEKAPNAWGLHDMLGNVYEWCHDGLQSYTADPAVNPMNSVEVGASRVVRGGCWIDSAQSVRAAYRGAGGPGFRDDSLGFRCSSSG